MRFRQGLALFLIVTTLAACNLPGPAASPSTPPVETTSSPLQPSPETPSPTVPLATETAVPSTDLPATETPAIEASPTQAPTPTPQGEPCLASQPDVELQTGAFSSYPQAVLEFLNAGSTLGALDQGLYAAGVANQPVSVAAADLTGDGAQDVAVSIYDPDSTANPPGGSLLIYTCQSGGFQLSYEEHSDDVWGAPGIRLLQDLNGDGTAELVAARPTCGAHTCFEETTLLAWDGSTFTNRLEGTTSDLPYPDLRVEDPEGDGTYDLIVVGTGFGSVGAGPQRSLIRVWVYLPDTETWIQAGQTLGESNYRIHVLHDAETSSRVKAYDEALLLYGRVIQDTNLEDWEQPVTERANLSAYALFKTALVYLIQGNQEFAQSTFEQLAEDYPAGETGHAYAELAEVFQGAYAAEESVIQGCAAARSFAEGRAEEILDPLGSPAFGYANPDYTLEDICPWE